MATRDCTIGSPRYRTRSESKLCELPTLRLVEDAVHGHDSDSAGRVLGEGATILGIAGQDD